MEPQLQTVNTVLVALADELRLVADVPVELDDPLLRAGGGGDVSDAEIGAHFLFYGNSRAARGRKSSHVGINPDAADAEDAPDAARNLARQGFGEQRTGPHAAHRRSGSCASGRSLFLR